MQRAQLVSLSLQAYVDQAQNRPVPTVYQELLESIRSPRLPSTVDGYDVCGLLEDSMDDERLSNQCDVKALVSTERATWVRRTQHGCSQQRAHLQRSSKTDTPWLCLMWQYFCRSIATTCIMCKQAQSGPSHMAG